MTITPWERLDHRLEIEAELVALTGLRVGAGRVESLKPTATDLPVMTQDDEPFIPGSSLRGVLRALAERLLRTAEPNAGNGKGACDPLDDSRRCVPSSLRKSWVSEAKKQGEPADAYLARKVWETSCRACRLFGSTFLASRLRIADLVAVQGQARVERRDGVAIDREKETVFNKYDFECASRGSRFRLRLTGDSLDEEERRLVAFLMKELGEGRIQVGGFKGRGLGTVTLENGKVREVKVDSSANLDTLLRSLSQPHTRKLDEWLAEQLSLRGRM